jgi:hypothetical protein
MGAQQRKYAEKQSKTMTESSALAKNRLDSLKRQPLSGKEDIFHTPITVLNCVGKNQEKFYVPHMKTMTDASPKLNACNEQKTATAIGALPLRFAQNNVQRDTSFAYMRRWMIEDAK